MPKRDRKKKKISCFLAFALAQAYAYAEEKGLVAVPADVLKTRPPGSEANPPMVEGSEIVMRPGVSVVTPIAYGHLNRIVTPFDNPQVRTVSRAQIQVHDKVVYVATEEDSPITLFITPNGRESPALPLILAPRKIPPREIRLLLPEAEEKALRLQEIRAADPVLGKDAPYVANIKEIMKALAKGKIPGGFSLRDPGPADRVQCFQSGLSVRVGQVLEGPGMVLRVALLRNSGSAEIELDETRCTSEGDPVAVAAWPKVRLSPGEAAELFVLSRVQETTPESSRPSLIEGGL